MSTASQEVSLTLNPKKGEYIKVQIGYEKEVEAGEDADTTQAEVNARVTAGMKLALQKAFQAYDTLETWLKKGE